VISLDHVIEVALLLLVAYLGGCVLGYLAHMVARAFAARQHFEARLAAQVAATIRAETVDIPPAPPPPRSAARRLAGAVDREAAAVKPSAIAVPLTPAPAQQRPPELPAPRGGKPDDLKQIKGIGAKTESVLNDLGIYHLDQIATWTGANVDWLEGRIAVKGRIRREQWVEQAILLMTVTTAA
jgi:predicted flap endonuclease-1-like 5' DNA nuclease